MGSCNFKADPTQTTVSLSKSHFQFQYCIGKGGFGKVWRVEQKRDHCPYAMKEMSKARIISKKSVNSVLNERKILIILKHPFIVNMQFAFQDRENLYLVMDLMPGGDLRFHLGRHRYFTEQQTRFFVACLLVSLQYLHSHSILHRDVKPENLVFDSNGFLHLTDFGIARVFCEENAKDTSGTPGYMAPQVMCRQNHGVQVDYFAVGVLAYEFMFRRRPYQGKTRKEIRDQILSKQVQIGREEIPLGWSVQAADFINRLIQRKPNSRLGHNGVEEIKNHPWLFDFPWEGLLTKTIDAPYKPSETEENFDKRINLAHDVWKDADSEALQQSALMLKNNATQILFDEYFFDIRDQKTREESGTTNNYN